MPRPPVRPRRAALELAPGAQSPRGRRAARVWGSRGGTRPPAAEGVRARRTPSSPPRPLLTCVPRGPATATTLRATRSPAAITMAAAIFPLPRTLSPGPALRLCDGRGGGAWEGASERAAAIGSAGREERVLPSYWVALLCPAGRPLARGVAESFHAIGALASSTIFSPHWLRLLVSVKVPFPLEPLTSFSLHWKEKETKRWGFPSS